MEKIVFAYNKKFAEIFASEKVKIAKYLPEAEIQHIGSTAVPGLGGKGIVDILIGIDCWKELENVLENLRKLGYLHIHPKEQGRVFASKIGPTKLGGIHLHLVIKNRKPYKELLAFRDYLRENKNKAKKYSALKKQLERKTKGDRKKYNELKNVYVVKVTQKAIKKY